MKVYRMSQALKLEVILQDANDAASVPEGAQNASQSAEPGAPKVYSFCKE